MYSFVIPSLHARRVLLERCLRSLVRELGDRRAEVLVVVDDEAAAAGLDRFASPTVTIRPVVQPGGAARRRNAAFACVEGDVVVLLDDDAEPLEGYAAALENRFADGREIVVQGAIWPEFECDPPAALLPVLFSVGGFNRFEDRTRDDVFISANCAFSRAVLDRVGPMREDLGPGSGRMAWGDDTDWHARATAAGFATVFDERIAVRHRVQAERVTETAILDRAERVGRTRARLEWDDRRPGLGSLLHQRALALWGGLRTGGSLTGRCRARRLAGYADELAHIRRGD